MKLVLTVVFLNFLLIGVIQSKFFLVETDEEGLGHHEHHGRPDHGDADYGSVITTGTTTSNMWSRLGQILGKIFG